MVETERPPEVDRALEFPAHLETSIRRMIAYGQCCCETAEVISGVLLSATLTKALREKLGRLRDGQKVMGREMLAAVMAATEEGKRQEAAMLELPVLKVPLTSSRDRPPATGRFVICETPACGNPMGEAQAVGSLERRGNRICLDCEQRHDAIGELPLEGGDSAAPGGETPQAFR